MQIETPASSGTTEVRGWWSRPLVWGAALLALFAFRLLYGLCYEFFFEDQTQIFLIGLRAYAFGRWPFFGADVVWTHSQIPGALQGLLIALPMIIAPYPEAPFVLLNLLSMAGVALIAWYICLRLPSLPRWLVWGWLMTIPWTLNYSAQLINTSYVLIGSAIFFVGFFESHPSFSLGRIPGAVGLAMMGFGIGWDMQFHMSWPLLLPYVGFALLWRLPRGWRSSAIDVAALAGGFAVPATFILPTIVAYGFHAGGGGTGRNFRVHFVDPTVILTTIARFLSFASLEVARWMGTDTAKRMVLLSRNPWLVPLAGVAWVVGFVHPVVMAVLWFRKKHPQRADWGALRLLFAASVLIVYAAYFFVMEPPQAHAFYVLSPIAFVFAGYCWSFVDRPAWRKAAGAVLVINIAFHLGLALAMAPGRSMYKNRAIVAAAVAEREPSYFGHRREYAMDAVPAIDKGSRRDPRDELSITALNWSIGPGKAILWKVTVHNASANRAYRDLLYHATYQDASNRTVIDRHALVLDAIQPGETRTFEVNDGAADVPFTQAHLEFVLAETLKPLRRPPTPSLVP
jgi:hypothetical protein